MQEKFSNFSNILITGFLVIFFTSIRAQVVNPNNFPACDSNTVTVISGVDIQPKWSNCWGKIQFISASGRAGDSLEGEWLNGKLNGWGIYKHTNGSIYTGELKNGMSNGHGEFIFPNGTKYVGEHKNDKKHGKGIISFPNGKTLEGIWENGKLQSEAYRTTAAQTDSGDQNENSKNDLVLKNSYPDILPLKISKYFDSAMDASVALFAISIILAFLILLISKSYQKIIEIKWIKSLSDIDLDEGMQENTEKRNIFKVHTHYDNLKVVRGAPIEVIRASYRVLSQKYHPDKNRTAQSERIMKVINEAWRVLSDPELKRMHDFWISEQEGGGGFYEQSSPGDVEIKKGEFREKIDLAWMILKEKFLNIFQFINRKKIIVGVIVCTALLVTVSSENSRLYFSKIFKTDIEVFPESAKSLNSLNLGEAILLFMPDKNQVANWNFRSNEENVLWLDESYLGNFEDGFTRTGLIRINILGKTSKVLKNKNKELAWSIQFSAKDSRFGLDSIFIQPGFEHDSFREVDANCYEFEKFEKCGFTNDELFESLKKSNISYTPLCNSGAPMGDLAVDIYKLSADQKKSIYLSVGHTVTRYGANSQIWLWVKDEFARFAIEKHNEMGLCKEISGMGL